MIWVFFRWEARRDATGHEPLIRPQMLRNKQLSGGLIMFFFQFLAQAGLFFVVPLYLSVCLGLSALRPAPGCCPLADAARRRDRDPQALPDRLARLVVRAGLFSLLVGTSC